MFHRDRTKQTEKGFTLLEILVVIFILGFILAPMMQLMGKSYSVVQEAKEKQFIREDFRFFSSYLLEDLMFANSVNVQHAADYDILSYVAKNGKSQTLVFDEDFGLSLMKGNEREPIVGGEKYEDGIPMVRIDNDGVIRFNFFARPLNVLFVTSIEPRTNEVNKK